jgi:two-component system, OmpR family, response regulator
MITDTGRGHVMIQKLKNILIIDDESVFREAQCDALTACGYTCIAVESAGDGIQRLKSEHYDLVLLDIMMDPLDGWDTLDLIKTLPQGQDIPVFMSSAKSVFADEILRFGEQISGFIKKPFVDDDLCEYINKFFEWYDTVLADATGAKSKGVPSDVCAEWILLSRQVRALNGLKEIVNPRCIPNGTESEEVLFARKQREIQELIDDKMNKLSSINRDYPPLPIRG